MPEKPKHACSIPGTICALASRTSFAAVRNVMPPNTPTKPRTGAVCVRICAGQPLSTKKGGAEGSHMVDQSEQGPVKIFQLNTERDPKRAMPRPLTTQLHFLTGAGPVSSRSRALDACGRPCRSALARYGRALTAGCAPPAPNPPPGAPRPGQRGVRAQGCCRGRFGRKGGGLARTYARPPPPPAAAACSPPRPLTPVTALSLQSAIPHRQAPRHTCLAGPEFVGVRVF